MPCRTGQAQGTAAAGKKPPAAPEAACRQALRAQGWSHCLTASTCCDEWPTRLHALHIFRDLGEATSCRWSAHGSRPQRLHDTEKLVSMPIRFDLIEWRDPAAVRSAAVHRNASAALARVASNPGMRLSLSSHFWTVPHVQTASIGSLHLQTGRTLAAYAVSFQLPAKKLPQLVE